MCFNPSSHCLICVSRLTATCHMRHPFKANLGKKWRRLWCLFVRPSARTCTAKSFKTERWRQIFTFFAITSPIGLRFEFWKTGWILRACWFRIYFVCFECSLLKASKAVKTTFRPVCVWETAVLTRLPESRKIIRPFEITSSKKWLTFFNFDIFRTTNLPVCLKLLYKVCGQSYHDVIIKKLYEGRADFRTMRDPPLLPAAVGAVR